MPAGSLLHEPVLEWYAVHARPLPWRDPACTPWGVLVSEVMAQQTPVARVAPVWVEWMRRWPTPSALAEESPGEVVRSWGRLGYPRRALRLREAAVAIRDRHGGVVPDDEVALRALPGVGGYTAAAVTAFAFGRRTTVVDTNVRRVLVRAVEGREHAAPVLTSAESALAAALVPEAVERSATWNVAVMELGAVVCTARNPRCDVCPVQDVCAWVRCRTTGARRTAASCSGVARHRPAGPGGGGAGPARCLRPRGARRPRDGGRTPPRSTGASPPWSWTVSSNPPATTRSAFRPDHRGVPRSGQTLQA